MRYLLDTHAFLWWITDDERLSSTARGLIRDRRNILYLSAASGWEIAINTSLGRLEFRGDPQRMIPEQMSLNAVEAMPIQMAHALRVHVLPHHHRDPFDRLLVAQSQLEDIPIITDDPQIAQYGVAVVW
ncbi:MAG: type II toxin-antitoxin system VapC family toxin [Chloroflexota bacterium]